LYLNQDNTPLKPLRSSVDRVVISALVCALGALGVLGWQFRQNHGSREPNDMSSYESLARTQLHGGQLKAAQQTCERAIKKSLDGTDIRHLLLQTLYAQGDGVGVRAQLEWGRNHPDALLLHVDEISIAISKGELHRANELLTGLRARAYPPELVAPYLAAIARALAEAGVVPASQVLLNSLPAAATQDKNAAVALAEDGEVVRADELLQQLARDHGEETLWKAERLPEIRAALALAKHQPDQALQALDPSQPLSVTFGPAYLRGEAYSLQGKPELAQAEYLKITEHSYIDPLSNEYPLALLASARAYVLQGQPDLARAQFERLFDLWKDADPDWPVLQAAQKEYDTHGAVDVTLKP
jgi:predicted negative regulator of RcsB-dependent stress response